MTQSKYIVSLHAWNGEQVSRMKNQMTRWSQRHTATFFRLSTHNTAFHYLTIEELSHVEEHLACEHLACEQNSNDNTQKQEANQEEWMLLCRLNQQLETTQQEGDNSYEWTAAACNYTPDVLGECPKWITNQTGGRQKQFPATSHATGSLTPSLQTTYETVCCHYQSYVRAEEPHPLRMIICGTAGIRKSFLIAAIAQSLGTNCLLTGTTGLTGFNMCSDTPFHFTTTTTTKTCKDHHLHGCSNKSQTSSI